MITVNSSNINSKKLLKIVKNRNNNKLEHSRGKENESFKGK